LTALPPRSAGSRLAASANERSFSIKALMAMAILLAIEIALARSSCEAVSQKEFWRCKLHKSPISGTCGLGSPFPGEADPFTLSK
jgi:hypothetical protein